MPGERDSPEQQLLYGRVTADARPPAGQPLHRVPLEVRSAVDMLKPAMQIIEHTPAPL
jgi:hypothetical protein